MLFIWRSQLERFDDKVLFFNLNDAVFRRFVFLWRQLTIETNTLKFMCMNSMWSLSLALFISVFAARRHKWLACFDSI